MFGIPAIVRVAFCFVAGILLLLGGPVVRAQGAPSAKGKGESPLVVFLIAEDEYEANQTLPAFAEELKNVHGMRVAFAQDEGGEIRGLEKLRDADLLVMYVRRRGLAADQMAALREYLGRGGALVALRTSSHAFAPRAATNDAPSTATVERKLETWPEFDAEILGCDYTGHYGRALGKTEVAVAPGMEGDPLLKGVGPYTSTSWLYKSQPLAAGARVLLTGSIPNHPPEPVAWTLERKDGGKVFYTCLGHKDDFGEANFKRLLTHAVYWAMNKPMP